jgi:hypothetical protein
MRGRQPTDGRPLGPGGCSVGEIAPSVRGAEIPDVVFITSPDYWCARGPGREFSDSSAITETHAESPDVMPRPKQMIQNASGAKCPGNAPGLA